MTFDAGRIRHDLSLMHYARASNGSAVPSNWLASTDGTTAVLWRPETVAAGSSAGSNSTDVSGASALGGATTFAPSTHTHRGVFSITSSSSNSLEQPTVNIRAGTNVGITATDTNGNGVFDTLTIHSSATGGGSAVSYGSNSTDVAEIAIVGALTSVARSDHYHSGVTQLTSSSSNTLQRGTVNLRSGTNMALTATDTDGDGEFDTVTFHSTGSGGGGSGSSLEIKDEGTSLDTAPTSVNFVGESVTTTVSSHAVTVTIPGGPIEPQPGTDSFNDEGVGASSGGITGWTTLGTVGTLDRDTTLAGHIYMAITSTNATRVDGIYKVRSLSNGDVLICKLWTDAIKASFNRAGIFYGENTPGKIETWSFFSNSGNLQVEGLAMTNPTTLSSQFHTTTIGFQPQIYLAIRRNSSTSYDSLWSRNGFFWTKSVSARNPSFTQGVCGLHINDGAGGGTVMKALFDWVRIYTSLPGVEL